MRSLCSRRLHGSGHGRWRWGPPHSRMTFPQHYQRDHLHEIRRDPLSIF
jgi:hypothetical protein